MNKKYLVKLTNDERDELKQMLSSGKTPTRTLTRVRILLKADSGSSGPNWTDEQICTALETSLPTVYRVRQRFVEEGLKTSLHDRPRKRHRTPKLDGRGEAHLIALACSEAPEGASRWTLRLLAEKFVELEYVESISHEAIRQILKKRKLNLG